MPDAARLTLLACRLLFVLGTHYLQSVSLGGKAQLIIKTSAQSLSEAKESSRDLAATVSASYGLFKGELNGENKQEEKSKVYNTLKDSKILVNQSPVVLSTCFRPPVAVSPGLSLSFHALGYRRAYFVRRKC